MKLVSNKIDKATLQTENKNMISQNSGDVKKKSVSKKNLSEEDIRKKISEHNINVNTNKAKIKKKVEIVGGAPAALSESVVNKSTLDKSTLEDGAINDPTGKFNNDPNDVVTQEKLKSLLNSDAIKFSPKERDVLGKILN